MTACWSTGRNARCPYYLCITKGCESYGKSIRREKVESEFEDLLSQMRPSQDVHKMAEAMFWELWDARAATSVDEAAALKNEARNFESKIEQPLDRIIEAESDTLIAAYEKRVETLEAQKALLHEKIAACVQPLPDFDETFRTAIEFLGNPQKLWDSE